ncbi:MAG: ATP-binding cassette domain-containing protein [Ilumatobacter sp.]|nr:ATP-binding cassette domain-containing protein [Ilumatobacter sp.]
MIASDIVCSGVHHAFADRDALTGVELRARGGIVTVLGANGAGKSTLLRCLATLIRPDHGTVDVDGLDPRREAERIEIRRRMGYLPQQVGFSPGATVFDVVDYFGVLKEVRDDRRRRHQVFDALDRVGLADRAADDVAALSGGMQRRLGMAQTLLGTPSLLILDEPSAGLDPDERLRLRAVIAERRSSTTIVVSTHLTDEAALGDAVVVLHDGRVRFTGTPQALADAASGHTWVQTELPPPNVRASWRLADGRHRCLGAPPQGATIVAPTIEDGYLLLVRSPD